MNHVPVLLREALDSLAVRPDGIYIDATLGAGGHAQEILKRLGSGRLLGLDRDPQALALAAERLAGFGEKLMIQHGNFAEIDALHAASGFPPADGVLADLGMSSMQLEDASRGFSLARRGLWTCAWILFGHHGGGHGEPDERAGNGRFDFKLGEERHSRRIARAIVKGRPYRLTTELAQVVTRAIPSRAGLHQIHPATRTFQALRLAVNRELENLDQLLAKALTSLRPGGRVVVISFHSLEDRLVKQAFRQWQDEDRATSWRAKWFARAKKKLIESARPQRQAASSGKAGIRG